MVDKKWRIAAVTLTMLSGGALAGAAQPVATSQAVVPAHVAAFNPFNVRKRPAAGLRSQGRTVARAVAKPSAPTVPTPAAPLVLAKVPAAIAPGGVKPSASVVTTPPPAVIQPALTKSDKLPMAPVATPLVVVPPAPLPSAPVLATPAVPVAMPAAAPAASRGGRPVFQVRPPYIAPERSPFLPPEGPPLS